MYEAIGVVPAGDRADQADPAGTIALAYEHYAPELAAFVARSFGGRLTPEDVVHEAFARLIREAASERLPDQLRPWLYRVAHNVAVSELRHRSRSTASVDEPGVPEPIASSAESEYEDRAVDLDLQLAVMALPPDARTVLLMVAEGYTGREIARTVGRSDLATRALLWRTRRALRAMLDGADDRGLGSPGRRPVTARHVSSVLMSA